MLPVPEKVMDVLAPSAAVMPSSTVMTYGGVTWPEPQPATTGAVEHASPITAML